MGPSFPTCSLMSLGIDKKLAIKLPFSRHLSSTLSARALTVIWLSFFLSLVPPLSVILSLALYLFAIPFLPHFCLLAHTHACMCLRRLSLKQSSGGQALISQNPALPQTLMYIYPQPQTRMYLWLLASEGGIPTHYSQHSMAPTRNKLILQGGSCV